MHYLLFYEVAEDYVEKRAPHRDAHLQKAWDASERGELMLGGAFANPADGAVLLFQGESAEVAGKFARADPYVISGAVKRWYVREWNTVAGRDSATPVWPSGRSAAASSDLQDSGMILRMWRGRAEPERAAEYVRHARERVFPALRNIEGHRGAFLLRRAVGDAIEFAVLTLWASMSAVARFAGPAPEKAVVEPEAESLLTSYEKLVTHFEVVDSNEG